MPRSLPLNYETKFAEFIRMCRDAKQSGLKVIMVAHPSVIGDNYEEVIESLSRLSEANLSFHAAKPEP
jgi:dihydrodipicolinate synthase/N-acetylneuraminate lyase